jgi:hypothetical protein
MERQTTKCRGAGYNSFSKAIRGTLYSEAESIADEAKQEMRDMFEGDTGGSISGRDGSGQSCTILVSEGQVSEMLRLWKEKSSTTSNWLEFP